MAERRMFSKKIIDSARFLKMPVSSQALYFHMGVRADDDGVVEGYNVMKMTGATEDDLKVLVAKGFVTVLNEDLVTYINDWKEHNLIRADRKVDSIYKDLLLQIIPEVQILEPKQRSDIRKKQSDISTQDNELYMDNQWTSTGQPMDTKCPHRLGKDSLVEVNIGKDSLVKESVVEKVDVPQEAEQSTAQTKKSKKFVKPSVEEIREYCQERQNTINAQLFYDYYEANGWRVGKNSMKDWKATIRNWERRDYYGRNQQVGSKGNIQQPNSNGNVGTWF